MLDELSPEAETKSHHYFGLKPQDMLLDQLLEILFLNAMAPSSFFH